MHHLAFAPSTRIEPVRPAAKFRATPVHKETDGASGQVNSQSCRPAPKCPMLINPRHRTRWRVHTRHVDKNVCEIGNQGLMGDLRGSGPVGRPSASTPPRWVKVLSGRPLRLSTRALTDRAGRPSVSLATGGERSVRYPRTISAIGVSICLIGAIVRLTQYFANRSLWLDEAMLANNIVPRSFSDLARALDHGQVAPIGFLWIEKALVSILGNNEFALRLFPLRSPA